MNDVDLPVSQAKRFKAALELSCGSDAVEIGLVAQAAIGVWVKVKKFIQSDHAPLGLMAINDPGYQWLGSLMQSVIVPQIAATGNGWKRDGFLFFAPPGADGEEVLIALAEALSTASRPEWLASQTLVDRALMKKATSFAQLRRSTWAAIAHWQVVTKSESGPVFICLQGENLHEGCFYEMQDLTNRLGCRFLVLSCGKDVRTLAKELAGEHIDAGIVTEIPPVFSPAISFQSCPIIAEVKSLIMEFDRNGTSLEQSIALEKAIKKVL